MQTYLIPYTSKKELAASLEALNTNKKRVLVQIFSGEHKKNKLEKLLKQLKKSLPQAVIIGASSMREIGEGQFPEGTIQLAVTLFESTGLHAALIHDPSEVTALKKKGVDKETKALILFSAGPTQNGEAILEAFSGLKKDVVIAGGVAGHREDLAESYVICDETVEKEATVALFLSGPKLHVTAGSLFNWKPIGKNFTITGCKNNVIHDIEGKPVRDLYREYIGGVVADDMPGAATQFPILLNKGTDIKARIPLGSREGGCLFSGNIRQGESFSFGFADIDAIKKAARKNFDKLAAHPSESIFVYASDARRTFLPVSIKKEIRPLSALGNVSGFFTAGEYYQAEGESRFSNLSTTILSLSESDRISRAPYTFELRKGENDYTRSMGGLAHLISTTTRDLEESSSLLQQYKEAVDSTVIFSKTDPNGIITYVNEMFCEVSGYSEKELLGQSHNIIRHPEMESDVFQQMWETIQSGQIWQGIVKNRAKDGHTYIVDSTIFPIFDQSGTIVEYMALRVDITFLSLKQKELEWREKLTSEILNNQESIVALTSKEDGLQQINQRFFDYFDFKDLEAFKAKHKCICDLFVQEEGYLYSLPGEMEWVDIPAKKTRKKHKVKMVDKRGKEKIFAIKTNRFVHDRRALFVVTLSDITELETAVQKAKAAETAKANFLANMSHEIRTPMNGILGFTELLAESGLDEAQTRYAEVVKNSTKTLVGIVNDILDISKIESGKMTLEKQPFDPVAEIFPAIEIFETVAHEKEVDYITFIDPALPRSISADALRLKQVMSNLIGNAIKFTPKGGHIYIEMGLSEQQEDHCTIRFAVTDTGIGIPKAKQEEIFSAFSQADDSITRKYGGTGLGLTISSNFVHLMGSQLRVESEEEKGSTFFFDLRVETCEKERRLDDFKGLKAYLAPRPGTNPLILQNLKRYLEGFKIIEEKEHFDIALSVGEKCIQLFTPDFLTRRNESDIEKVFEELQFATTPLDSDMACIRRPVNADKLHQSISALVSPQLVAIESGKAKRKVRYADKVLVAEDNEINQSLITLLLEKHGISPAIADNGEEAYYIYADKRPDLILMDINMPLMDGMEATRNIRRYEKENGLDACIIVALTANVMSEDREKFLASGMDDYLTKPIEPVKLDSLLARYGKEAEESAHAPYDLKSLSESLDIDEEYLVELIGRFKAGAGEYFEAIEDAVAAKDQNALFQAAHKLNGTAANFHFHAISSLAQQIENIAKKSAVIDPELMAQLRTEIEKLHA